MPPKQQLPVKKGQPNLFSFFSKPAVSTSSQPSSDSSSVQANTTPSHTVGKSSTESVKHPDSAATSKAGDSPFSALSSQGSQQTHHETNETSFQKGSRDFSEIGVNRNLGIVEKVISKRRKEESSEDELSDSSEEGEMDDDDSDDDQVVKKRRLQKGRKPDVKPSSSSSRPPLPPVRGSYTSTPSSSQASQPFTATPNVSSRPSSSSQSQPNSVYDRCSAQNSGGGKSLTFTPSGSNTPSNTPSSVSSTPYEPTGLILPEGVHGLGSHEHNGFDFLQPGKIKDKNGNRPDHPLYNPRTLYIPASVLKDQTPAMGQWWLIKQDNMDTVLFFKVGKFYELFHMDADVGMSELDLIYMKGSKGHSGFPEVSYGKYAGKLVSKGYRVARVEQTETPEMLKERNDSSRGKKDKVVAREMCSIMSKGTRTYCHLDDLSVFDAEGGQGSSLLICVKERLSAVQREDDSNDDSDGDNTEMVPEYGICCVDTVIGTITLAQFQDDTQRSRLRTLLTSLTPTEVLLEAGHHTAETAGTLRLVAPRAAIEVLRGEEMPEADEVVKRLHEGKYFPNKAVGAADGAEGSWPHILQAVTGGLGDGSSNLVMCAIGGAVWQLKRSLIDFEVVSMGSFVGYVPPDEDVYQSSQQIEEKDSAGGKSKANLFQTIQSSGGLLASSEETSSSSEGQLNGTLSRMVLDAVALTNLEVLQNNFDRSEKGSLWAFLNRCKTLFGARLLKDWVCHPLFKVPDIKSRTAAVDDLLTSLKSEADKARAVLKSVPDLERLLARVHSLGLKKKGMGSEDHPDSRAVMYEMPIYNSRKIRDFSDVLTGFESVLKIAAIFENSKVTSPVLTKIVKSSAACPTGKFPGEKMDSLLRYFRTIFDEKQAKKDGNIRPLRGVVQEYDQAKDDIAETERNLESYLREMKIKTKINDLKFWGTNKDRFQIEVPIAASNKVPSEWTTKSQKKTHRRYWTPVIEDLLATLVEAEDREKEAQKDTLRRVFEKFDDSRDVWTDGLRCAANLDALLSLALVSSAPGYIWPEMVPRYTTGAERGPELDIQGGRHPMLEFSMSQKGEGDYIPNTLVLGGALHGTASSNSNSSRYSPKLLLLSGPNMGGKSTLLRQTCLITILAQVGCKVPADRCVMTPVDRIFTRVGASDRILAGQSTFFVELAETATILKAATEDSLCILDELGRGTATFDGTAIAHAVVDHLARHTRCRSLFATHYHSLVDDWEMDARVQLGHMDCLVQGAEKEAEKVGAMEVEEEVTFLYRLCSGSSPRSYGINVARLARLPAEVIALAMKRSREFEQRMKSGEEAVLAPETSGDVNTSKDVTLAYFERLVSIAHSDVSINELAYLASEMWRRFTSNNR